MRFFYRNPKSKMIRQEFQNCNYILSIHIIFCLLKGQNDNDDDVFECMYLTKHFWLQIPWKMTQMNKKWQTSPKNVSSPPPPWNLNQNLKTVRNNYSKIFLSCYTHNTVCILKTCRQQLNFKNIFLIFPRLLKNIKISGNINHWWFY